VLIQRNDTRPLVSVLTPSFNHGRFLGECIRSVAQQTYRPLEHIICDGGSTDSTIDVLHRAPENVRWISEPDRGQSHALNKALSLSTGEIVGWINSDDAYLDPAAVEAAVDLFRRRPDVDVVYGHAALVNAAGLILHLMWAPSFSYRLLRAYNFIVQPTVFLRRTILGDSIVDEEFEYAMDRELWLRLGEQNRFARVDRIVAIDRHHPGRKVYRRDPRTDTEGAKLDAVYVRLPLTSVRAIQRAYRPIARLAGIRLVAKVRGPTACEAHLDSLASLCVRQVAVRRKRMALGTDEG
jgi:glycosyltransferase involved in cell wall biosynthesis